MNKKIKSTDTKERKKQDQIGLSLKRKREFFGVLNESEMLMKLQVHVHAVSYSYDRFPFSKFQLFVNQLNS